MAAVVLWVLWLVDAMPLFWLGLVALALPAALALLQRGINHLLRPPGAATAAAAAPSLLAVCLERGLRVALLIGAVYFLAWAWDVDAARKAAGETMPERLLRGLLHAAIIVLLADFAWHVLKTGIDRPSSSRPRPRLATRRFGARGACARSCRSCATWRSWCSWRSRPWGWRSAR